MHCMHLAGDVLKPTLFFQLSIDLNFIIQRYGYAKLAKLLQGTREINMRGAKIKAMSDESSFYMK